MHVLPRVKGSTAFHWAHAAGMGSLPASDHGITLFYIRLAYRVGAETSREVEEAAICSTLNAHTVQYNFRITKALSDMTVLKILSNTYQQVSATSLPVWQLVYISCIRV